MITNREQFVIDKSGNKTAVLLDIDRYTDLLEAQEELESIRAFDEAKASNEEAILSRKRLKRSRANNWITSKVDFPLLFFPDMTLIFPRSPSAHSLRAL